jgi:4-hydroxy-tetrahydrodipicolinate reductase
VKINLLGYGKMGHMIEEVAQERGHAIVHKFDDASQITAEKLLQADVAIEFSTPQSVLDNIRKCVESNVPVIVGTTGWNDRLEEVKRWCFEHDGAILYASNFSVGVNMLFGLNEILAKWMARHSEYKPSIYEVHHTQKLDHPSGTAITLANGIMAQQKNFASWQDYNQSYEGAAGVSADKLPIFYERKENVAGYHKVSYTSEIDTIEIAHNAFNRKGFALGAVLAAEFILGKKGVYTTKDLFNFTA